MIPLLYIVSANCPDINSNAFMRRVLCYSCIFWWGRAPCPLHFLQNTWLSARMPTYKWCTFSLPIHFSPSCAFTIIFSLTPDLAESKDNFRVGKLPKAFLRNDWSQELIECFCYRLSYFFDGPFALCPSHYFWLACSLLLI